MMGLERLGACLALASVLLAVRLGRCAADAPAGGRGGEGGPGGRPRPARAAAST